MGTDSPIAVLSSRPRLLFDYFTQLFAQVTNPPLDAIREELVTSLGMTIGPEGNALEASPAHARQLVLPFPVIDNDQLAKIVHINADGDLPGYATFVVRGLYDVNGGAEAMHARLEEIFVEVSEAIRGGARFVVLSDRDSGRDLAPIPSLLLTSAVHHHLIREKTRTQVGLLVEAGDVREVHHVALLVGYGAAAVNPYLAMESVEDLIRSGTITGVAAGEGGRQPHQGARQGRAQGDVEDGHLDRRVLPRRPGVRGDRPLADHGRALLHGHRDPARRRRPRRHRRGGRRPARRGLPAGGHPPRPPQALGRRRVPVAPRGRAAPVRPRHGVPAAARHAAAALRHLQAVHRAGRRAVGAADDAARPVRVRARRRDRPARDPDRRGRAGQRDRQAVQHRSDELRLDQPGGPPDPRHRHEPDRREVQHRRGWRGRGAPARPRAPLGDQAGRLRPVRGDEPLPHRVRRHPDQDGAGRQAGRGRPAARPEGLPLDRQDPALDARRRPHLTAAPPRHLLHRGPRPAHPRPQERQPLARGSTSSWSPRSASAPSRRASPRRTPTSCSSPDTTVAPARHR